MTNDCPPASCRAPWRVKSLLAVKTPVFQRRAERSVDAPAQGVPLPTVMSKEPVVGVSAPRPNMYWAVLGRFWIVVVVAALAPSVAWAMIAPGCRVMLLLASNAPSWVLLPRIVPRL